MLSAALSLGDTVVALAVAGDDEERHQLERDWGEWKCSVPLEVLIDPHRSLIRAGKCSSIRRVSLGVRAAMPAHEEAAGGRDALLELVLQSEDEGSSRVARA